MADSGAASTFAAATAPLTFAAFLEKMRCSEATDIVKAIKAFLTEFATQQPDAERDADRVQVRCWPPRFRFAVVSLCACFWLVRRARRARPLAPRLALRRRLRRRLR